AALKDLDEALKGDDKDAITAKTEALMTASQKLGEQMYAQAAEQAQPGAAAGASGAAGGGAKAGDDTVVDAEFKEVKDGKA
ncbi:MAG: molecular chaperone DnaK, partial [Betaproteobacteria bacterium]|nr:molecular chaperone DnaK [Betaproteobacteria bacterium]